jgi:CBS-domain-containing membrane protein
MTSLLLSLCGIREETAMRKTVEDVMTKTVVVVGDSASFKEMVELMDEFRVSALPVLGADRRVVGIVSEADLLLKEERPGGQGLFAGKRRRLEREKAEGLVASQVMSTPAIIVSPRAPLAEAARLMHRHSVKRLPVVDGDGKLLGIVSRADLLRVFLRSDEEIRRDVTREVIQRTLWIGPREIAVSVHDGIVDLDGMAERKSLIPIIVDLVKAVDGVVGVQSRLGYQVDDELHHGEFITPWGFTTTSTRPSG